MTLRGSISSVESLLLFTLQTLLMCMSSTMAKCLFKVLVSCYVCVPEGDQSSSVLCVSNSFLNFIKV